MTNRWVRSETGVAPIIWLQTYPEGAACDVAVARCVAITERTPGEA